VLIELVHRAARHDPDHDQREDDKRAARSEWLRYGDNRQADEEMKAPSATE
jgi:hypothetical protein